MIYNAKGWFFQQNSFISPFVRVVTICPRIWIHYSVCGISASSLHLNSLNRDKHYHSLEAYYYHEYEYISFFAVESESNHPMGEMVTTPFVYVGQRTIIMFYSYELFL